MPQLKPVEEVRLRNFLSLQHRIGGYGAPTAKHFAEVLTQRGAAVTPTQLTFIYQKEKAIGSSFASKVEVAMALPQGWISEDHEFLFSLTPAESDIHRALATLPKDVKGAVSLLVRHLANAQ